MEKKGLGKGLGALIPGAEREQAPAGMEIDIDRISLNPFQPRESVAEDKLQELVDSIRVHGVLQPIVVRSKGGGDYELVAGERRLRAARSAGLARVPAVVRELTNEQSLEVALVENLQREDINPMDAAGAYKRLVEEFGLSQEDLAFGIGKSRSAVANTMRLLSLPDEVKAALKAGTITEGHARAILAVDGEARQLQVFKRIADAGLSVRAAERLAREWSTRPVYPTQSSGNVSRETSPPAQDPNLLEVEAELRKIYGTKVNIIRGRERGRIEIEFYSEDDLERLLLLLTGG